MIRSVAMRTRHRSIIGDDVTGTGSTVAAMRTLIDEGGRDPRMIALARRIASRAPEGDINQEIEAIFDYTRGAMRYVRDPVHAETLTDSNGILSQLDGYGRAHGDCDEHVIFLGSLLEGIGVPVETVVESYASGGRPTHVALRARVGDQWRHLDPTLKEQPIGAHAGKPTRTYSEKELTMRALSPFAALGVPPALGDGGTAEALTGKNADSAWSDFFGGVQGFGDWAFSSPYVKQWVMDQQISNAKTLAQMNKKFGRDVFGSFYGTPADLTQMQVLAFTGASAGEDLTGQARPSLFGQGWSWETATQGQKVAIGAGGAALAIGALALAFGGRGRRRGRR